LNIFLPQNLVYKDYTIENKLVERRTYGVGLMLIV